jgi:hypothetical protein
MVLFTLNETLRHLLRSLWDLNKGVCLKAALGKHGTQVQKIINDENCGESKKKGKRPVRVIQYKHGVLS